VPSTFKVLFRYQVPLYDSPHFILCFHNLRAIKGLKFSSLSDVFYSLGEQMLSLQELQEVASMTDQTIRIIPGMRLTRNTFLGEKYFPLLLQPPQTIQGLGVSLLVHITIHGFS
jgi:hypothetical protein